MGATLARAPTRTQVAPPPCSRSSTSRSRAGRRSPTQCAPPPRSPTSTPRSPRSRTRRRLETPLWLTWRQLLRIRNPQLPAKTQPQLTLRPCRLNLWLSFLGFIQSRDQRDSRFSRILEIFFSFSLL